MGLKSEILQIMFGSFLFGLFVQVGILSPANNFFSNVISGIVIFIVARVVAFAFTGQIQLIGLRHQILQIGFGSLLLGIFIQVGILSPANNFFSNVVSGIVIFIVSKLLAFIFGGRSHQV